jgi:hypothetical protein
MSTVDATEGADQGFFSFYREYAHTGIHAASTAGLTAFGLLTFVHRAFVVLAIGVYVIPPIYLYLTRDDGSVEAADPSEASDGRGTDTAADPDGSASAEEPTGSADPVDSLEPADSTDASRSDEPSTTGEPTGTEASGDSPGPAAVGSATGNEDGIEGEEPAAGSSGSTDAAGGPDERSRIEDAETTDPEEAVASSDTGGTAASGTAAPGSEADGAEAGAGSETAAGPSGSDIESESAPASESEDRTSERGVGAPPTEASTDEEPTTFEWTEVDAPTDGTLSDVVAAGSDAYAVGTGGVVLAREGNDDWETVLDHGPGAGSNALVGVDATDDGSAVWFTGDSGALGRYDVGAGRHTDRSAPAGITDNWTDVAVSGPAGEERVYLVNGSGQVLAGEFDDGEVEWGEAIKPGSGSSMSAIEFLEGATGYCCDTNSGVYETTDGESFERIGIDGGGAFTALAAADRESLAVADDDGTIQRYDGSIWTPLRAAEVALDALATDGSDWFAVGDGGTIRELVGGDWEPCESPVETDLHGVAVGDPSVAVGADGTLLERRPAGE